MFVAFRRTLLTISAAVLLPACSHVVFYNESRDKQAQETQKAVTAAHVADSVASLEKAFADVADREETSVKNQETYLFDQELQLVSKAKSIDAKFVATDPKTGPDGLLTVVKQRLVELGLIQKTDAESQVQSKLTSLVKIDTAIGLRKEALAETILEAFGSLGHRFANCADIYAASTDPAKGSSTPSKQFVATLSTHDQQLIAADVVGALVDACQALDAVELARVGLYSGGLAAAVGKHKQTIQSEISNYATQQQNAQSDLDTAMKAFKEQEEKTVPGKSRLEVVQGAAQKLQTKLNDIIEQKGAAATHVIAAERLKQLTAILGAIAAKDSTPNAQSGSDNSDATAPDPDTDPLSPKNKVFVALIRGLPELQDTADQLLADARKPRLVPLLMAIDNQKLVIQGLENRRQAQLKRLDAAQRRLDAVMSEGLALAKIRRALTKDPAWAAKSINQLEEALQGDKNASDGNELHRAFGLYADDVRQARIDAAIWAVRETSAQYEDDLAQSKSAAAQWDNLTDTLAKVLADYHAAGIKQADIAEFLKALGLVATGVGVNR